MALDALIGFGGQLGLREEAVFGTEAGNPTHWLPILSATPRVDLGMVPIPYLGVANAQVYHSQRDFVQTKHDADLDVTGCATYDSPAFALLLKHAFGSLATTGAGPYDHTITPDTDGVVGLTASLLKGTGLSTPVEKFTGGRITRFEFDLSARGWLMWRALFLFQASAGKGATAGTPGFPAAEEVLGHHAGQFTMDGHGVSLRRFRCALDNNLVRRPRIGSLTSDVFVPGGHASITWDVERSFEDHDYFDLYRGATSNDATLTFTGSGNNELAVTLHNAVIASYADPVDRAGELVQRFGGFALADASDQGLTLVLSNDNSPAI